LMVLLGGTRHLWQANACRIVTVYDSAGVTSEH
jgi:hypothetical protein